MGRSSIMEIPPPEQRLCKKHGKPICPSQWRKGCRTSECAKCIREVVRSPKVRKRRASKWEKELIPCRKHSNRRCNKSAYVCSGKKVCGSCHRGPKLKDGSYRRSIKRHLRVRAYRKSINLRKYFRGRMRGLKLFERSTGFNLETVGFTRKEINENL
jgi:hypothetical protein